MSVQVRWSECEARIKVTNGRAPGKKLRCPECDSALAVPGKVAISNVRASTGDEDEERPRRSRREDEEKEVRRRAKKRSKARSGGGVPVLVWVVLALVLVGGSAVGAYFAFFNKSKDTASIDEKGKTPDTGPEGRPSGETNKGIQLGMSEQEVTRLLGPATTTQPLHHRGRNIRVLVWVDTSVRPPSQFAAEFTDGKLTRISGNLPGQSTTPTNPGTPGTPGGGEPNEPEGRLTAGNFKKLRVHMNRADVFRIIGAGKVTQDRVVRDDRVQEVVWEITGTAKPTKITGGFVNGTLIDATGTIDGARVSALSNTPGRGRNDRVNAANYQKIDQATANGTPMTRAQLVQLLGEPNWNLGSQTSVSGQQADETLVWVDGPTRITVWFLRGQNIGVRFREKW